MADSNSHQNIPVSLPHSGQDVSDFENNSVTFNSSFDDSQGQQSSWPLSSGQSLVPQSIIPQSVIPAPSFQDRRLSGSTFNPRVSRQVQGHVSTDSEHFQDQRSVQNRRGQQHVQASRSGPIASGTTSSLPTTGGFRPTLGGGLVPSLTSTGVWSAPCSGTYPVQPPALESNGTGLRNSGGSNSSSDSQGSDYVHILNGDEGWDLQFVPARSEKYDCPICLLVLREPMQTECGHRFCKSCILKWLRESEARCPVDNQPLEERQLFPDNFAKREILALTVKCPNHQKGCDQIVVLKHLQSHLNNCVCSLTPCPNVCGSILLRGKLSEHIQKECSKRKIKCSYCQSEIVAEKQQVHILDCPQWTISCPSCSVELVRQQLQRHLSTECQKTIVKCQYNLLGCPYEGERHTLEEHERTELGRHMGYINRAIIRLYMLLGLAPASVPSAHSPSALGYEPTEVSNVGQSGAASFPSYFVNLGDRMNLLRQLFERLNIPPGDTSAVTSSEMLTGSLSISTHGTSEDLQATGMNTIYSEAGSVSVAAQNLGNNIPATRMSGQSQEKEQPTCETEVSSNRTRFEKLSYTSDQSNRLDQEMPGPSISEHQLHSIKCQNDLQDESLARHDQQLVELSHQRDYQEKVIRDLKTKVKLLENHVQDIEGRCGNGMYVWKIKNYHKLRRDAEKGEVTATHSPSFYSSYYGYKLCIRVNPNGVDSARGTHLSLFIHFMQGEYDDLLEWPFSGRIVLTVVDQNPICELRSHISETLTSKPNLAAFQRPVSLRNHKGFGYMEFLPLSVIDGSTYVRNDTLIIKAHVYPTIQ